MTKADPTPEALAAAWKLNPSVIMTAEGVEQIARAMDEFAEQRTAELRSIVDTVDDVLVVNWVGPRKDGDYRKALADLVQDALRDHGAESSRLRAEVSRLRGALEKMQVYALKQYWNGRGYLDAIDGWIRGDDGPVYPLLKVSEFATAALSPEPGAVAGSLLRSANDPPPSKCYCKPGHCMAPVIMGRQMPCLDPAKAAGNVTEPAQCPSCPHPAHQGWCPYTEDNCHCKGGCTHGAESATTHTQGCRVRYEDGAECTCGAESGAPQSESAKGGDVECKLNQSDTRTSANAQYAPEGPVSNAAPGSRTPGAHTPESAAPREEREYYNCDSCGSRVSAGGVNAEELICIIRELRAELAQAREELATAKRHHEQELGVISMALALDKRRAETAESELAALKREVAAVTEPFSNWFRVMNVMLERDRALGIERQGGWEDLDPVLGAMGQLVTRGHFKRSAALHAKVTESRNAQ